MAGTTSDRITRKYIEDCRYFIFKVQFETHSVNCLVIAKSDEWAIHVIQNKYRDIKNITFIESYSTILI